MRTSTVSLIAGAAMQASMLSHAGLAERLDAALEPWVSEQRIVGAVILVARDGRPIYRRAAGFADREAARPVTEDTVFRLASMTKLIVSATALALVDRGRLRLDDPVTRWLPYFTPPLGDRVPVITVRQLMTHTAGLSYSFFEPGVDLYTDAGIDQGLGVASGTLEENLRKLASVPLYYPPGREWRYSMATDVLGALVEQAAGMPLPEAVARYVTEPLGMHDTAFVVADPGRLAAAYRDGAGAAVRMLSPLDRLPLGSGVMVSPARALDPKAWPSGGGGMSGTAADYLALLEAVRRGGAPILSARSAAALTRHAIGELRAWTEGEGWGFSLGAAVLLDPAAAGSPQSAGTWQWGGALGSHFFVDPPRGLSVVVLTNTAVAGVIGEFPRAIIEAVYGAGDSP